MARTLLIEDEAGIRMTIGDREEKLRPGTLAEGYQVEAASDGQAGFERAREGIETPLLMLTAKGQLSDRVRGLRIGADDYLVPARKPQFLGDTHFRELDCEPVCGPMSLLTT